MMFFELMNIRKQPDWQDDKLEATPEAVFTRRRQFVKALGMGGLAAAAGAWGTHTWLYSSTGHEKRRHIPDPLRPQAYRDIGREITPERYPLSYNNFYEFTTSKSRVANLTQNFSLDPYSLSIEGLVHNPQRFALDKLEKMELEERVYRFRCVEAWAMVVPWIGFPLHKLLNRCRPLASAKYVSFTSFHDPEQAPNQKKQTYPWPYYEALRIDEAMNELTLLTLGHYGKTLAPQCGAPVRMVIPWKYGFKGAKSIVKITLTDKKPATFWNDAAPNEYGFYANVDPKVPHPRWSQAQEKLLGSFSKVATLPFNGYEQYVADLYPRT